MTDPERDSLRDIAQLEIKEWDARRRRIREAGFESFAPETGHIAIARAYLALAKPEKCPACGDKGCSNYRIELARKRIAELEDELKTAEARIKEISSSNK